MGQNTIELGDNNFSAEVLESTTPVLVDFWPLGADHAVRLLH